VNQTIRRGIPLLLLCGIFTIAACGGGGGPGPAPGPAPDEGFRVTELTPFDGELFVSVDRELVATFSEALIPGTIDESNFLLAERASGRRVAGTVTMAVDRMTATFRPDDILLLNTGYQIRILPDVTSVSGEYLSEEHRTVFTTALTVEDPPPPPPPSVKGKFRTIGAMKVGRSSHTATLLGSGKVLITAGFRTGNLLAATGELYDPATDTFRFTGGQLTLARGFHTATRLTNGEVLIAGGLAGSSFVETPSAELYDPNNDRYYYSTAFMNQARAFHSATLLYDGRVLVAGGTVPSGGGSYSSKTAEIYDPNPSGSPFFKALPNMAVYRAGQTATRLSDGRVVLIGGNSSDLRVEIYNPVTETFTLKQGELKTARRGHTATLLPDGNILVMGGGERSAEIYLTMKDYFVWAPGYPQIERRDHTANFTDTGYVLFTGGSQGIAGDTQNPLFFHRNTEMYDPASGAFVGSSPLLDEPRTRHRATTLSNGEILVTGGANVDSSQPELNTAEVFSTN
jgi:hypothetical protein